MILSFVNQKGGVGKTTTTHNIGVALHKKENRVLLVDLDPQASLTISAGKEPVELERNITDVFKKNALPIKDCIIELKPGLDILPSVIDLASIEVEMLSRTSRERTLERAIKPIVNDYDYILIDCPPQLGVLTVNALSCSDYAVVVTKTDYLSYRGIDQLQNTIDEVQELANPSLKVLGIVATFFEISVKDDKEILEYLQEKNRVLGVVKKTVAARKGVYEGAAAVENEPKSDIAREYTSIADKIIEG